MSNLARYLVHGFRYGFRIQFIGNRAPFESPNLKSALQNPDLVLSKLQKEIDAGRIVGPLTNAPFPDFRTSPIGIVPKKTPNEVRLIQHLSYPSGFSVNDNIPDDCSTVHYATINQAVKIVQRLGVGCFMAKTDIKSAFRIIPIHPQDYSLLGIKWADKYYFDRCLPMGCSSSCAIFETFSTALEWLSLHKLRASAVLHILDDFLFVAPSAEKCEADLANFLRLCDYLGVPIAHEKTVQPRTTLEFAGITLDSVSQEARLPPDKLQKCRTLLHQFHKRRTVTLRELQSLIGLLNFACSVVVPGRAFLRRLVDLTKGIKKAYHHIRLNKGARHDIKLWLTFLDNFNGRAFFLSDRWETSATLQLFTDAAGSKGYGAVFGSHWFYGAWPGSWRSLNISCLELFPITLSVHVWGYLMANQRVVFFTDNAALVDIINKQSSKHKLIMALLRPLILCCLRHNILFKARHVPGLQNSRADFISRFQIDSFKAITPDFNISHSGPDEPSTGELVANLRDLLSSALKPGSRKLYQRAWAVFQDFAHRFYKTSSPQLPLSPNMLALFISYLSARQLAPSTIASYISALSYVHKLKSFSDPTKSFLIQKLLTAVSRRRKSDIRLPITRPVLHELVRSLRFTNSSAFQRTLYRAMFLLAFYGFFRIGELAANSAKSVSTVLQFSALRFLISDGKAHFLKLVISEYKHNVNNRPFEILGSFSNDNGDGNENVTNLHIQWAKTIALHAPHVRFSYLSISLPSSAKQQREITKFEVLRRTSALGRQIFIFLP